MKVEERARSVTWAGSMGGAMGAIDRKIEERIVPGRLLSRDDRSSSRSIESVLRLRFGSKTRLGEESPQGREGPDDDDVDRDGAAAPQDGSQHGDAEFGECEGRKPRVAVRLRTGHDL